MGATKRRVATAVLWASLAGASFAQSIDERREELREELLTELDDFATWADKSGLYLARNETFAVILELDPEHERARKGLRYKRERHGDGYRWKAPKRAPKVRNKSERHLPEMEERRAAMADAHRDQVLAVLEEHELSALYGEGWDLLETCLLLDPDDEEVRGLRGEVLDRDEWVLRETAAGRRRRPELGAFKEDALSLAGGQVEAVEASAREASMGVSLRGVATPAVRVLGSCSPDELRRAAIANHAVGDFFRKVFGKSTSHVSDLTLFFLSSEQDRDVFLNNYPDMSTEEREFRRALGATGFPESEDFAAWSADPLQRLDSATRHTMSRFLLRGFDTWTQHGWIFEGFGLYLTRALIGTRMTWYVTAAGSDPREKRLRSILMGAKANWMSQAFELMKGGEAPPLEGMLSKGIDTMNVQDTLVSYALAAYLLEGWPEQVGPLLESVGGGVRPAAAFEEHLGMDLPCVAARLHRWIGERR